MSCAIKSKSDILSDLTLKKFWQPSIPAYDDYTLGVAKKVSNYYN